MIDQSEYQFLARLLREHSGLSLGAGKEYLIESRLVPVAASLGYRSLRDLIHALQKGEEQASIRSVCEAMTTNESFFFRDSTPFLAFQDQVLPQLLDARRHLRRLRIWSCAASTGQEPYTLAMILDQMGGALDGWSIEILATDYSRPALARARAGLYNHFEIQRGLPARYLTRYFEQRGDDWQVRPELRRWIRFEEFNLLDPFAHLGTFDIVFCRNVLIYFDVPTKQDVLERLAGVTAGDGFLVLGGSETAMGITNRFERLLSSQTSIYRSAVVQQKARIA